MDNLQAIQDLLAKNGIHNDILALDLAILVATAERNQLLKALA